MTGKNTVQTGINERGFEYTEKIVIPQYDSSVQVYESSAVRPHIWLHTQQSAKTSVDNQDHETMIHLSLKNARKLRDSLDYLLNNHYSYELYGRPQE